MLNDSHWNHTRLLSYQKSVVIYDLTYHFCSRFIDKRDRTYDQMVQAARSGKQNIVEGYADMMTSKEMGIKLLPPDVNESDANFTVAGENLRYGLVAIKGIGWGAINGMVSERTENGPFTGFADFCSRMNGKDMNRRAVENLIRQHQKNHNGAYPAQTAIVLWTGESVRTGGLNESILLRLIGMEPVWDTAGRVRTFRPVPGSRLGRPRLDAVVTAQSTPPNTQVPVGTTIKLTFADIKAAD